MSLFGNKIKEPYWTKETHLFDPDIFICSECGYKAKKAYETCPGCGKSLSRVKYEASWVDEAELLDIIFDED